MVNILIFISLFIFSNKNRQITELMSTFESEKNIMDNNNILKSLDSSNNKLYIPKEGNDERVHRNDESIENDTFFLYKIRTNMIKLEILKKLESDIPNIAKINEVNKYNRYFGESKYRNNLLKGLSIDDF